MEFKEPRPGEFEALLGMYDGIKKTGRIQGMENPNPKVFDVKKCHLCGNDTLVPKTFKGRKPECKLCRGVDKALHQNHKAFTLGASIYSNLDED